MGIFKVAVTGGAASGKTSVCKRFEERGVPLVISDLLAREVVEPGEDAYFKIVEYFGRDVVLADGGLDRMMLRRFMTEDPHSRTVIENIVQPAVISLIFRKIADYEKEGCPIVVVEVPLLFELGMEARFDLTVLVCIERERQIRRLVKRDGVTAAEAEALLDIQMDEELKYGKSDVVIENNGTLEMVMAEADRVFEQIVKKKIG